MKVLNIKLLISSVTVLVADLFTSSKATEGTCTKSDVDTIQSSFRAHQTNSNWATFSALMPAVGRLLFFSFRYCILAPPIFLFLPPNKTLTDFALDPGSTKTSGCFSSTTAYLFKHFELKFSALN